MMPKKQEFGCLDSKLLLSKFWARIFGSKISHFISITIMFRVLEVTLSDAHKLEIYGVGSMKTNIENSNTYMFLPNFILLFENC